MAAGLAGGLSSRRYACAHCAPVALARLSLRGWVTLAVRTSRPRRCPNSRWLDLPGIGGYLGGKASHPAGNAHCSSDTAVRKTGRLKKRLTSTRATSTASSTGSWTPTRCGCAGPCAGRASTPTSWAARSATCSSAASPKDFDIATDATPQQLRRLFRTARLIGRRFRIVHVYFGRDKWVEVTTFRAEKREGSENFFGTMEEDARTARLHDQRALLRAGRRADRGLRGRPRRRAAQTPAHARRCRGVVQRGPGAHDPRVEVRQLHRVPHHDGDGEAHQAPARRGCSIARASG